MFTFVRTASTPPGKIGESLGFAREVAEYITKNHGVTIHVGVPVLGNPGRIMWETRYDSLADYEAFTGKLRTDPGYQKLIEKAAGLFIPGSMNDEMWSSI